MFCQSCDSPDLVPAGLYRPEHSQRRHFSGGHSAALLGSLVLAILDLVAGLAAADCKATVPSLDSIYHRRSSWTDTLGGLSAQHFKNAGVSAVFRRRPNLWPTPNGYAPPVGALDAASHFNSGFNGDGAEPSEHCSPLALGLCQLRRA